MEFFRIRDAVFATHGFSIAVSEAAPEGLSGKTCYFAVRDRAGNLVRQSPITEFGDDAPRDTVIVNLTAYRSDPARAAAAVKVACEDMAGALNGDAESMASLGATLFTIVRAEAPFHDAKTALGLVTSLWGAGRVQDELNRRGNLKHLAMPDLAATVAEGLGRSAS